MILLVATLAASAQQEEVAAALNQCERGIGGAGGFTPGGRDWDFTTPGTVAWTGSPVLAQGCIVEQRVVGAAALGFGMDVIPTYQHGYRRIGVRAPLLVALHWDIDWRLSPRQTLGPSLVTNGLAVGGGLRWRWAFQDPGTWGWAPGLDVRANVIRGTRTDYQLVAVLRFSVSDVSGDPEPPEGTPPEDVPPAEPDPDWRHRVGFEAGSVIGVRAESAHQDGWGLGLRVGEATSWRRDVALQPLGLAYVVVPPFDARIAISGGSTRFDGEWVPVAGAGLILGESEDWVRLQLGWLFDPSFDEGAYRGPDVTFAIVW
jgi:hypothetical protein